MQCIRRPSFGSKSRRAARGKGSGGLGLTLAEDWTLHCESSACLDLNLGDRRCDGEPSQVLKEQKLLSLSRSCLARAPPGSVPVHGVCVLGTGPPRAPCIRNRPSQETRIRVITSH